jgi:hypothetical protein
MPREEQAAFMICNTYIIMLHYLYSPGGVKYRAKDAVMTQLID